MLPNLTSFDEYMCTVIAGDTLNYLITLPRIDAHPVLYIFYEWQKDVWKSWKWNQNHRHITTGGRVPWHDDRSFPRQKIRSQDITVGYRRNALFSGGIAFGMEEMVSIYIIGNVFKRKRVKENTRRLAKNLWWKGNTHGCRATIRRHYEEYQMEIRGDCPYIKMLLERGMTYRHVRVVGYIPFLNSSIIHREEFVLIREEVNEIARAQNLPPPITFSIWWWPHDYVDDDDNNLSDDDISAV
jgi:hypothetical protein